jgi:hypothetical protein
VDEAAWVIKDSSQSDTLQVKYHGKKGCLMNFIDLKDFLTNRMRISHIYQLVMLITVLKNGGVASVESLA